MMSDCKVDSFRSTANDIFNTASSSSTAVYEEPLRPKMLCFIGEATALIGQDMVSARLSQQQCLKSHCPSFPRVKASV